jgi:hypothetical protein
MHVFLLRIKEFEIKITKPRLKTKKTKEITLQTFSPVEM